MHSYKQFRWTARPPFKEIAVILQQGTALMLAGCSSVFLADFHPTS